MERLDLPDHVQVLLDAVVAISSDLDLHSVLERITAAACPDHGRSVRRPRGHRSGR